ncbi:MAG TPA: amidohydrolase family protein [Solirubrobacteraceae bacterium]|nr:amidohydrolase family protein [Solirubrobacteraceae bacterium]
MTAIDDLMRPWLDRIFQDTGPLALYDAHTHVGRNDPDGFKQEPAELVEALAAAGARAVVFPMHEPAGYPPANDAVIAAAAADPERLVAYCRVSPHDGALAEATRALDAGARGIKLHPRAERFGMEEPVVGELVALAGERRVPVLIHAGRGIPALGELTVRLAERNPGATLILAHAAISDLAWLWRVLPDHPNVLVDTAWWNPVDLVALFALSPPANIVWASDSPYGRPLASAVMALRCALQAGLTPAQLRGIAGGTMARVLDGEAPEDLGPPPGQPAQALDLLLERCHSHLASGFARFVADADWEEPVVLARLACAVGTDGPHADVFSAVLGELDRLEAEMAPAEPGQRFPFALRHLVHALVIARTPDVPLPDAADVAPPTRAAADAQPE